MDLAQRIIEVAPSMNRDVINLLQSEIGRVNSLITWGLTACGGGFLFLLTLILKIPSNVEKGLKTDIGTIKKSLSEIKDFLLGTYEQRGAITKLAELEKEVKKLKEKK